MSKTNYEIIKNSGEWEEIRLNIYCPKCNDDALERQVFMNKETFELKVFEFCWVCDYANEIRGVLRI